MAAPGRPGCWFHGEVNVRQLVYFEASDSAEGAISREKQLKKWQRAWKIALIERENPDWRDLSVDVLP